MISVVVISKNEVGLAATLQGVLDQAAELVPSVEVVVVDASAGALDDIRQRFPVVRWVDYLAPADVRVSIPHQRNRGVAAASGDVIVFIDAGCLPRSGWLANLTNPIVSGGESVVAGVALTPDGAVGLYDTRILAGQAQYVEEFPTINVAFRREVFDEVDGFDESFEYGSDIDFSWRVVAAGFRVLRERAAIVEHDWGSPRRQIKRAFVYGKARARLYRKHSARLRSSWRQDPMIVVYPAFIAGLPLALLFPPYLLLVTVPLWRNRQHHPFRTLADHLAFGLGVLREGGDWLVASQQRSRAARGGS